MLSQKPLSSLNGAGIKTTALLAKLGITSIDSLLTYYPRDYEDRSAVTPLNDYYKKKQIYAEVIVTKKEWFGYGCKKTLKVLIQDESASACLVCFGRSKHIDKMLETGDKIYVYGAFSYRYGELQCGSFELEKETKNENSFLPVYPLTEGLTQNVLRKLIKNALLLCENGEIEIAEDIPKEIIKRESFMNKKDALFSIHFPKTEKDADIAVSTIKYGELYKLESMLAKHAVSRQKARLSALDKIDSINDGGETTLQKQLKSRLSFSLTTGQESAVKEINSDIKSGVPMERLLQGDVGSGKTLVSFMAALAVIEEKGQCALMAPTELLARQHAETAAKLLEPLGIRVAFLTGNIASKSRRHLLSALASGEIDFAAGTHALFSEDVIYKNLRLVVIDEQHRFGIEQRLSIINKAKEKPHLLMMSATPIPRTLALTIFGDWDVSVIKEMPKGRIPIETHLARKSNSQKVYEAVRAELKKGHQAYFVYPLIEKKEEDAAQAKSLYYSEIKDCVSAFQDLSKNVFTEYKTALLHSQIDEDEKREIMEKFRKNEIQILVATSVVEVGVDVPNAAVMVIEHAERFGLSALHQLRGRVGRGDTPSFCYLIYTDEYTEEMRDRLLIMHRTNDGFAIAEEDLKIRGPGQITGLDQSGFMKLGLADPIRDRELLEKARKDAFSSL